MSQNKKFKALVSKEKTSTLARNQERIKKREMLRASQAIALQVLNRLDELDWTQKRLAEELGVTPQMVNKIVRGKENLTLETIVKLQNALDIKLLELELGKKQEMRTVVAKSSDLIVAYKKSATTSENLESISHSAKTETLKVTYNPSQLQFTNLDSTLA